MNRVVTFLRTEPVTCAALLTAAIACATAFGLHWTPEQVGAVTALWAAFSAVFVRQAVTPTVPPAPPA